MSVAAAATPWAFLNISGGLQYLDAEYTSGQLDDQNLDLPFAPDWTGNLAATVMLPLGDGVTYLRGDYSYMGDHLTNVASAAQLEAKDEQDRENLSMMLGWRNDHWNVSLWGKNLTDEEYAVQTLTPFPVTDMDAYFLAPPKTYGATLRYDF